MRADVQEATCSYWSMSITHQEEVGTRVKTPDGERKILKVMLNGIWLGPQQTTLWPLKDTERYIIAPVE